MAMITAMQYTGFTVTPLLGALLGRIGSQDNSLQLLNKFNSAVYVLLLLAFIQILLLIAVFEDQNRVIPLTQQVDYIYT